MREPKPINRIELSEKNTRLRWIAVIALLVIGVLGITIGITSALNKDSGWQTVFLRELSKSDDDKMPMAFSA